MGRLWPLANRRFAWLWAGQVCSVMGDNLYNVALAWFAVRLAGGQAAYLVAGFVGGPLADRCDRLALMVRWISLARWCCCRRRSPGWRWAGSMAWRL